MLKKKKVYTFMFSLPPFWIALTNHSINVERSKNVAINVKLTLLKEVRLNHTYNISFI